MGVRDSLINMTERVGRPVPKLFNGVNEPILTSQIGAHLPEVGRERLSNIPNNA